MKIYLASSWRNEDQPMVLARLRKAGHRVYDFRNPTPGNEGFSWKQVALVRDENGHSTLADLARAHAHEVAAQGFRYDFDAMNDAEVCVLLLPCGRSAHLEAGHMAGQGKSVYVLLCGDRRVEPELMYKFLTSLHDSIGDLLSVLPNPDLGYGFKQWDRIRLNCANGSYGEVLSKHPTIDQFYVRFHYGLDVRGEPMHAKSMGINPSEMIHISDEEWEQHTNRRGFAK